MDAMRTLLTVCAVLAAVCGRAQSAMAVRNVSEYNQHVPDEQRLYRYLMRGYESSTRPVPNASDTVLIDFDITLNQINDLDERTQVLTTNVFIDQTWQDENLLWHPEDYNYIRSLRIPEHAVWLPDTFLFNNADEGATGFMRGMYVSVNNNGTVLWRVPVKLQSSCKVDITYFPFDDQKCQWQFGSWIYSGPWIDFESSKHNIHMEGFMDNSEWELLSVHFEKHLRQHPSSLEEHPDLLFTLHIRRRTLYYIFNIIAPCVMLSVLTLLTFWLPNTSGEKISLGLSVFLAFSMFMLLIAEEVPATSESVPLIGIYLTTVMTMTSVSVIMAVMVINLYNRGSKAVHAPRWLRILVLEGLSRMLGLKHDIDKMTKSIKLGKDEEEKYSCLAHPKNSSYLTTHNLFHSDNNSTHNFEPRPCRDCDSTRMLEDIQREENLSKLMEYQESQLQQGNFIESENFVQFQQETCFDESRQEPEIESPETESVTYQEPCTCLESNNVGFRKVTSSSPPTEDSPKINTQQVHYAKSKNSKTRKRNTTLKHNNNSSASLPETQNGYSPVLLNHSKSQIIIPEITITDASDNISVDTNPSSTHSSPVWRKRPSVILREQREKEREREKEERETLLNQSRSILSQSDPQILDCSKLNKPLGRNMNAKQSSAKRPGDFKIKTSLFTSAKESMSSRRKSSTTSVRGDTNDKSYIEKLEVECPKKAALIERRQIVVEWQTIAAVTDRLLFWIFLLGTVVAYLVILILIPHTKPDLSVKDDDFNVLRKSRIKGVSDELVWT